MSLPKIIALFMVIFLIACSQEDTEPQDAANLDSLLGPASGNSQNSFAKVLKPREFVFPEDHLDHPDYQTEWWYFTGNLQDSFERHFGYQLTFFRYALAPETIESESPWRTNQLWMAHFAVTDTQSKGFYSQERFHRQLPEVAGVTSSPIQVWLSDWQMQSLSGASLFPLQLAAKTDEIEISLRLDARAKPHPVLQGDRGFDAKGPNPGNASHYYSYTRLETRGSIYAKGQEFQVAGDSWLDREWSSSVLESGIVGWDWFALQLDDQTELMLYRLRKEDGSTGPFSSGILVSEDQSTEKLAATDWMLSPVRFWTSDETGARYPVGWILSLPSKDLSLEVMPVIDNQEMNLSVRYWEGAVRIQGQKAGQPISGRGYLEMTGY